ncbi:hypothetical protein ITP53_26805 [Nonomuraea sp. K274]|uniref:Uncharacterized protein n=1 Tax=Nonomuraea cypriaca TaxID=1187855 RepID=A0A931F326_9ACTN|nr:hypothetical protein [Nonomuraea cypriaca]MBF8189278.1 hypothetical protein [Nonomuraea cypriaca]
MTHALAHAWVRGCTPGAWWSPAAGAHQELLLRRLRAALRLPISAAPQPRYATVRGLMRLCPQPDLAAGLAPHVR